MKSGDVIWAVIFVFYILSVIMKRRRAAAKAAQKKTAGKRPEWKKKLDLFLAQVERKMETEETKRPPRKTGWEMFMPPQPDAAETLQPEPAPQRAVPKPEKPPKKKAAPAVAKKTPLPAKKPVPAASKAAEPAALEKQAPPEAFLPGGQDLQRAVIWSEILAPPLALRRTRDVWSE